MQPCGGPRGRYHVGRALLVEVVAVQPTFSGRAGLGRGEEGLIIPRATAVKSGTSNPGAKPDHLPAPVWRPSLARSPRRLPSAVCWGGFIHTRTSLGPRGDGGAQVEEGSDARYQSWRRSPPFRLIFWLEGTVHQHQSLEAACTALRLKFPHEAIQLTTKEDPETPEDIAGRAPTQSRDYERRAVVESLSGEAEG
ncbi:hypothetical protein NDU88_004817 [Pleurodeles waltl]|uniref:Uncharacterized protein n=1 Tax=Pleurodeles waltl TaxID=8319 RepID=A0AAV7V2S8_PLEWA|nr:hypothetical protein NDU88_004817 [Pleurodeles waltl]